LGFDLCWLVSVAMKERQKMRRSETQKVVSSREGMFSHAVSQLELPTAIATGFDMISILFRIQCSFM
jgi:hypothetical protein